MSNTNRITVVLENGKWKRIRFTQLKKGDDFKLFEENGNPVGKGALFKANSDAFFRAGIWTIDIKGKKKMIQEIENEIKKKMLSDEDVKELIREECIQHGNFRLASGRQSNIFCDLENIVHRDDFRKWFANQFFHTEISKKARIIPKSINLIGPPTGANALISAITDKIDDDGNYDWAEPCSFWYQQPNPTKYIIIDDVVTTGISIYKYLVKHEIDTRDIIGVISVVDRSGEEEQLSLHHPINIFGSKRYHSIFKLEEITNV